MTTNEEQLSLVPRNAPLTREDLHYEVIRLRFGYVFGQYANYNFNRFKETGLELFTTEQADNLMSQWADERVMPDILTPFIKHTDEIRYIYKTIEKGGLTLFVRIGGHKYENEERNMRLQNFYFAPCSEVESTCYYCLLCFISSRFNLKRGRFLSFEMRGRWNGFYCRPHLGCHIHHTDFEEGGGSDWGEIDDEWEEWEEKEQRIGGMGAGRGRGSAQVAKKRRIEE